MVRRLAALVLAVALAGCSLLRLPEEPEAPPAPSEPVAESPLPTTLSPQCE